MEWTAIRNGFGAELLGADCTRPTPRLVDAILEHLLQCKFVLIRGQHLDPGQYEAFMGRIGRPVPHVLEQFCVPRHRNILVISNLTTLAGEPLGVREGGAYWHTDMSYLQANTVATSLYALHAPGSGGQTRILDAEQGYRLLQDASATRVFAALGRVGAAAEDIQVIHEFGNRRQSEPGAAYQPLSAAQRASLSTVRHPLALRHPVTGRKSLYAVAGTAMRIERLSAEESFAALNEIEDFLLRRAAVYEHTWRLGDLLVWDNLSTLHTGVPAEPTSDPAECRLLYRMNVNYLEANHD